MSSTNWHWDSKTQQWLVNHNGQWLSVNNASHQTPHQGRETPREQSVATHSQLPTRSPASGQRPQHSNEWRSPEADVTLGTSRHGLAERTDPILRRKGREVDRLVEVVDDKPLQRSSASGRSGYHSRAGPPPSSGSI